MTTDAYTVILNGHWVATCANQEIAALLAIVLNQLNDDDDEGNLAASISPSVLDQLDPERVGV